MAMAAEALRSEFLCSLTGLVAPPREIGTTPRGIRQFYLAIGGSFEGPRLRGEVLPDGGDWLLMRPDGALEQGEAVDSSEYYFRVAPVFETGAELRLAE
jgi:Protein of unknown function (DUF3237)